MLLILVLELQEIRRRISFDRMMMDVVKEEKIRLRREYKHLKNQGIHSAITSVTFCVSLSLPRSFKKTKDRISYYFTTVNL